MVIPKVGWAPPMDDFLFKKLQNFVTTHLDCDHPFARLEPVQDRMSKGLASILQKPFYSPITVGQNKLKRSKLAIFQYRRRGRGRWLIGDNQKVFSLSFQL